MSEFSKKKAILSQISFQLKLRDEFIRDAVINYNRMDILAEQVLGLKLKPFHREMQRHILNNPRSLQMAFRGAGKTTTVSVVYILLRLIQDRNVRILIASKTSTFAKKILKEVREHLESNKDLIRIFGTFKDPKKTWGESEIEVSGRTKPTKDLSVSTVGFGGQVVGGHYDLAIIDDLVDEDNTRTQHMRDRVRTFFTKTLKPTIDPTDYPGYGKVQEIHMLGTRFHSDDLYADLEYGWMKGHVRVTPALSAEGLSPWPERFPSTLFKEIRAESGKIAFESQYQCNTSALAGDIFDFSWFEFCRPDDVPFNANVYMGVDLAIGQKEENDYFAMALIAEFEGKIYVLRSYRNRLTFKKQQDMIMKWFSKYDPILVGIEANGYQHALAMELKRKYPNFRTKKISQTKDKKMRAHRVAARIENKDVLFVKDGDDSNSVNPSRRSNGINQLVDELIEFPNGAHDDLFDALEIAIFTMGKRRRRKRSETLEVI